MIALAPETEKRMDAFRRALAWGDHFRLIPVAASPGPAREEILARLRAWSGREDIPTLVEVQLAVAERPVGRIRDTARALSGRSGIVLVGLDQHLTSEQATPAIQELNYFRDELPNILPGPLVIVGSPEMIAHLLSVAPDFASVRAFSIEVTVPTATLSPTPTLATARQGRDEAPAAEVERLSALVAGMATHKGVGDAEQAWILLRLGAALLRSHDFEGANRRMTEALDLFQRVGDVLGQANCVEGLGDLALRLSDYARAEKRFEEARPLYDQVGTVLGEADCIASLGDVALRRSDHESSRALFEEALRLFRQFGDSASIRRAEEALAQLPPNSRSSAAS